MRPRRACAAGAWRRSRRERNNSAAPRLPSARAGALSPRSRRPLPLTRNRRPFAHLPHSTQAAPKQTVVSVVAQKKIKVAINGFGRIGRNFLRCWEGRTNSLLDVVAINDSGGVKQASHLLKYDSTLGKFDAEVKVVDDSTISVNGKPIKVVSSRDPTQLPWGAMGIDLVIEGTGVFIDSPGAGKHITAGAKKVRLLLCGCLGLWSRVVVFCLTLRSATSFSRRFFF